MDPRRNPYAPGAGSPPPELAGRDELIERAAIALDRIRNGRAARSFILYGLRGVGKTVLLNRIRSDAESRGIATVRMEAPEERSLPALLLPSLRATLLRLSRGEAARARLKRALQAVAGFAKALKFKYSDIEVGVDFDPEPGLADSGDLENDLSDLLTTVGEAARDSNTAVVLFIDELQYVPEEQLGALISAIHHVNQDQLPVTMIAAGLPQLLGQMGRAKSYAERLFEFVPIDRLDDGSAKVALCVPAEKEGVAYKEDAIARFSSRLKATLISSRNGGNTVGTSRIVPQSKGRMPPVRRARRWQSWTPASFAFDLTGSRLRRNNICLPWHCLGRAPTVPATSLRNLAAE